jgi:FAD/FMN-containing dehydrogenase
MITDADVLTTLRDTIQGRVLAAGQPGYDEARRVWNGMIDRRPKAIVEVAGVDDIAATIGLVREMGLPLAIRGGGHNVAGNGTVDDGILLDLGPLDSRSRLRSRSASCRGRGSPA